MPMYHDCRNRLSETEPSRCVHTPNLRLCPNPQSQLRARVLSELRAGTTPGMRAVRRVPNTRQEEAANLLMMEHLMASGPPTSTKY